MTNIPFGYRIFERVRQYFGAQSESIPMSFVLGFYVSLVVKRWWEQYKLLPWPDTLALFISAGIPGAVSTANECGVGTVDSVTYFVILINS
ncbi:jg1258 [Pararge aegeria aegeria]|uniref:Bestrophin homolog n=1 Tax=Pararge aegeria aegeria TaxID=348720 RepID=A0A8S4QXI8_9NEOP|nr:jg1258 [Pararge aegeria aegeria]